MESNKTKKHRVKYSQICNEMLSDKNLSLKSKGLYSFMFSKPDDFTFTIRSMSKLLLEGQRSIMASLQELKEKGWITYTKHADGTGEYFLNEKPELQNSNLDEPNCQNPNIGFSNLLKEQPINNTIIDNNKDNNKKEIDFEKLLLYFNKVYSKKTRIISKEVKALFNRKIKDGYTKEDVLKVIDNCYNDNYHKENEYKYVTLEFLSRPKIFERYAAMEHIKPIKADKQTGYQNF